MSAAGTQRQRARDGEVTPAMEGVAERENRDPEFVREQVAQGQAVIPNNHDPLDPERARAYHDQTIPGDNYNEARFCSMCGVEFCSMRIDQDARDVGDGEMADIDDETDLSASPAAAAVNRPTVGTHDTSDVPDEIEIDGVTFTPEEGHADD